eukprot:XP_023977677.1 leukocyte elastase inhibitor-like [Physeter catodon]
MRILRSLLLEFAFMSSSLTMEQLSAANTRFALDLFRTLNESDPAGNIFISPFSISSALAMVFLGARGNTAAQMSKALYFKGLEEIHSTFQSLNADINKHGAPYTLKVANRLFGEKSYDFLPEFLASTQKMYGAELASVDFLQATEDARKAINEWVKGQTEEKPRLQKGVLGLNDDHEIAHQVLSGELSLPGIQRGAGPPGGRCVEPRSPALCPAQPQPRLLGSKSPRGRPALPAAPPRLPETLPSAAIRAALGALRRPRAPPRQPSSSLTMEQLSAANTRFALDLFRTLNESDPAGNIFISPFSISSALAMVFLGARGNTAAQMSKALYFKGLEEIHSTFQSLNADINKHGAPYTLKVANRLFGEKSYDFLPEFLASTQKMYGAELASVDFLQATEDARKAINEWVKGQTEGERGQPWSYMLMLPFLLPPPPCRGPPLPFPSPSEFLASTQKMYGAELASVDFLQATEDARKAINEWVKGQTEGTQIEQQLTLEKLREWTRPENLDLLEVRVQLPRFRLEESYKLGAPLARLGMEELFSSKADLSGMSGARDLFISKVVHKSFVEVNEEGTEAAAATAGMAVFAMLMPEEDFTADHPFIFFIRHNPSTNVLFLGRLSSP